MGTLCMLFFSKYIQVSFLLLAIQKLSHNYICSMMLLDQKLFFKKILGIF